MPMLSLTDGQPYNVVLEADVRTWIIGNDPKMVDRERADRERAAKELDV